MLAFALVGTETERLPFECGVRLGVVPRRLVLLVRRRWVRHDLKDFNIAPQGTGSKSGDRMLDPHGGRGRAAGEKTQDGGCKKLWQRVFAR